MLQTAEHTLIYSHMVQVIREHLRMGPAVTNNPTPLEEIGETCNRAIQAGSQTFSLIKTERSSSLLKV
jgi:hypothetical protein